MLVILGLVFSRAQTAHAQNGERQETFKIGWIGALSGPIAKYGAGQAAVLALEDVNAAGGVLGKPLELIYEDVQGKGSSAVSAFQKLTTLDRVKFIVGGHSSPETLPIAPLTRNKDVLLVAAITSSPRFTGASPHSVRLTAVSLIAGRLMAEHAFKQGKLRNILVLAEETDYVLPVAEEFMHVFEKQGGRAVSLERFAYNETDFRSILTKLKKPGIDGFYLGVQSVDTAALFMRQANELGLPHPAYGNETVGNTPQGNPSLAELFAGMIYAEPSFDTSAPKTARFIERFNERYHLTALPYGIWTAEAYDAVVFLAQAINQCGADVEKVRACMTQIKDYVGASGKVSIGADGDGIREYKLKRVTAEGKAVEVPGV